MNNAGSRWDSTYSRPPILIDNLQRFSTRSAPGRGTGVGRSLGVTKGLAVGVGLAVAVGVAVAAAVGVGVGLPVDGVKAYTLLSAAK